MSKDNLSGLDVNKNFLSVLDLVESLGGKYGYGFIGDKKYCLKIDGELARYNYKDYLEKDFKEKLEGSFTPKNYRIPLSKAIREEIIESYQEAGFEVILCEKKEYILVGLSGIFPDE